MKIILALAAALLLSCGRPEPAPAITAQQLQCLNQRTDEVRQAIAADHQTYAGQEQDVYLFKTTDGRVLGYLFEQGECSTVMTRIPANGLAQAEAFIAAEVKKNFGPLFITPGNVQYKYYTAPIGQNTDTYLVAQALN
ncbi:hypothetical protein [Hymenobacter perfusus]|uniref:Lipoprotein n=1 Tax=Hymenobacter perfusus TaxID=1236770 RepID=A0A428JWJ3_9BACT|nr:hypothetical protein [Hymenobacter perfusus]RSK38426.1 hypothetical protein EI293_21650 [Hymenobacter perfusus]